MNQYIDNILGLIYANALNVLVALVILFIGFKVIKMITNLMRKSLGKVDIDETLFKYLITITNVTLKIFLIISLVTMVGIPTTSFVALIGSAGLAVGLALQGSLSNFAGGVLILLLKPFKVGDFIEAQGYTGTVQDISIFYTILNTVDNKRIVIPNGPLSNGSCVNYNANDTRRVDFTFGVGYEADIKKVKEVINEVISRNEKIMDEPAPFVRLSEHGDSSINFTTRVWCKTEDYWEVHFYMMEEVKIAFDKEGINIPYPHMDVTMLK
ncbi:mechanosensitive ion channel family protein [Clostridium sp. DL1XJH146]